MLSSEKHKNKIMSICKGDNFSEMSIFILIYLFTFWLHSAACRILVPQPGNPHPLHWKLRVLTTGPPGKSLYLFLKPNRNMKFCSQNFRIQNENQKKLMHRIS